MAHENAYIRRNSLCTFFIIIIHLYIFIVSYTGQVSHYKPEYLDAAVDEFGTHGLSCQKNAGEIPRHMPPSTTSSAVPLHHVHVRLLSNPLEHTEMTVNGRMARPWCRGQRERATLPALIPWLRDTTSLQHSRFAGAAALSAEKRKHKKYEGVANLYKLQTLRLGDPWSFRRRSSGPN
jgi:hypothetical protein